jgi:hypothetical protein
MTTAVTFLLTIALLVVAGSAAAAQNAFPAQFVNTFQMHALVSAASLKPSAVICPINEVPMASLRILRDGETGNLWMSLSCMSTTFVFVYNCEQLEGANLVCDTETCHCSTAFKMPDSCKSMTSANMSSLRPGPARFWYDTQPVDTWMDAEQLLFVYTTQNGIAGVQSFTRGTGSNATQYLTYVSEYSMKRPDPSIFTIPYDCPAPGSFDNAKKHGIRLWRSLFTSRISKKDVQ